MNQIIDIAVIALITVAIWFFVTWRANAFRAFEAGADREWDEVLRVIKFVEQTLSNRDEVTSEQKKRLATTFVRKILPDMPDWKIDIYIESAVQTWNTIKAGVESGQDDEMIEKATATGDDE